MKDFQYKGYTVNFERVEHSGAIIAIWSNQYGENRDKAIFYDYTPREIIQNIKITIDDSLDKLVTYRRNPTPSEVRFGHGTTHYKDFILGNVVKHSGGLKKWIVCPHDGLRYYR